MSAGMWRIPASQVKRAGFGAVIEDRGMMMHAATASNGMYLFSEVGAGVKALALVGAWHEVLNFLTERRRSGIDNRIEELPEIYMGMCFYQPGQRFKGLFPFHDAVSELVKGAAGFAPGTTITDIAGAAGESYKIGKSLFGRKKKAPTLSLSSTDVFIRFDYLPGKSLAQIGSRRMHFDEIFPLVKAGLEAMV